MAEPPNTKTLVELIVSENELYVRATGEVAKNPRILTNITHVYSSPHTRIPSPYQALLQNAPNEANSYIGYQWDVQTTEFSYPNPTAFVVYFRIDEGQARKAVEQECDPYLIGKNISNAHEIPEGEIAALTR